MATTIDMREDASEKYPIKITYGREDDYITLPHKSDEAISLVESEGGITQVYNDEIDALIAALTKMKEFIE